MKDNEETDLVKLHQARLAQYEDELYSEIPQAIDTVKSFKAVLKDECKLTDAMANMVFKDYSILRNASLHRKKRNKSKKTGDESELIDDESYKRIQDAAKEHSNRLRRLKGKSRKNLTQDEILQIERFIAEKETWIREKEQSSDYLEYVFKAQPIVDEFVAEKARVEEYLTQENEELDYQDYLEQVHRKRLKTGDALLKLEHPSSSTSESTSAPIVARRNPTSISEVAPDSDIYSVLNELRDQYLELIGERVEQIQAPLSLEDEVCGDCHEPLIQDSVRAEQACPKCGIVKKWTENSLRVIPFTDTINAPKNKGGYVKRTYYEKWKKMVSGELNGSIPDDVWERVYQECINRKWSVVTKEMIKKLLSQMKLPEYYSFIPIITSELNGVPLIKFSKEEEAALDEMFDEAILLFQQCPQHIKRRENYLSYGYHFYQCCRMLGYESYLDAFKLLCGTKYLKSHDKVWKWMCEHKTGEPKWIFLPTV